MNTLTNMFLPGGLTTNLNWGRDIFLVEEVIFKIEGGIIFSVEDRIF